LTQFPRRLSALALAMAAPAAALAEADGPDYYRVIDVRATSVLNVRAGPAVTTEKVGALSANARGLKNLGCECVMSFDEWASASADERAAARRTRWCRIEFGGLVGWVAGWHLAEDTGPPAPEADR
jgi:uncharacterized protein YraI